MLKIDISTEEKKHEVYQLFDSFSCLSDIHKYYKTNWNSTDIKHLREVAKEIGFDLSIYRMRRKKYCLCCGKELNVGQKKFCSYSCSATYNNKLRGPRSQETKDKISSKLKKNPSRDKKQTNKITTLNKHYCVVCGNVTTRGRKTCSQECLNKHNLQKSQKIHDEHYKYYLENEEEFCRPNYTPKYKKEFISEQGGVCAICGCSPVWNGKELVFILDHIDGDASNNRRSNLRCICPNCDSQLDTYKSKNKNSTRRNYWKEKILRDIAEK